MAMAILTVGELRFAKAQNAFLAMDGNMLEPAPKYITSLCRVAIVAVAPEWISCHGNKCVPAEVYWD